MKEKISVIVPCYSVEKYLNRCVDSILNQTYENLEVLLIDDGSTDKTYELCEAYLNKDNRVKVIHQKNMGLSGARNTGIENATSSYYVFIDSDDEILKDMIEVLYDLLKKYEADISCCSYLELFSEEDEAKINDQVKEEIKVLDGDDKYNFAPYYTVQWNKLFKKEIFRDIKYPLGMYHEDEFVVHKEAYNANKIVCTNKRLYKYYRNPESITRNPTNEKIYHAALGFKDRIDFFEDKKMYKFAEQAFYRFLGEYNELYNPDLLIKEEYIDKLKVLKKEVLNKYEKYHTKNGNWLQTKVTNLIYLLKHPDEFKREFRIRSTILKAKTNKLIKRHKTK